MLYEVITLLAAEAVEEASILVDAEGRRLLVMERAEADPSRASLLEAHVLADYPVITSYSIHYTKLYDDDALAAYVDEGVAGS